MSKLPWFTECSNPTYRPDIDGLRGVAILAVLAFHVFPNCLPGGYVGVDIFFVVSGYLITSIIDNEIDTNSFSFLQFYCRRIRRLYPSLILVLIACYAVGWHFLCPADFGNLNAYIFSGAFFFANFLANKDTQYFNGQSDAKPLLHLWSLGIEEQFYIIWPVIVYIARKIKLNVQLLTIVLALISFAININQIRTDIVQTFFWPTSRFWELLIGAQLSFVSKSSDSYCSNSNRAIACNTISIVGILLTFLPMYLLGKKSAFPGWWALAPTTGTAFLILVGPACWINQKILSTHVLVAIGLISYPLYLYHWPLLVFVHVYAEQSISIDKLILVVVFSFAFAWLAYWFIERAFRTTRLSNLNHLYLIAIMSMIGFVALLTYHYDGLPNRFSPYVRSMTYLTENYFRRHMTAYGVPGSFISPRQGMDKFGTTTFNMGKPASTAVVLWGDSHAAHLRPGILAQEIELRFTQLTASECPPIYGYDRGDIPLCKQINNNIFRIIASQKPNVVLLVANWVLYPWQSVGETIAQLRNASIKNIYLIGPMPEWSKGLPRVLCDYNSRISQNKIPFRLTYGLNPYQKQLDNQMETFANSIGVEYISQYKILCNSDGCLVRTGESISTITVYDLTHLTIAGSQFVVSQFPKNLFRAQ
ncbi:unnamed protein product [Adineta ricciae]|uniref:Acyltransferase n=1 Tax=Adineta ricciae TaxID=249248 RepID=A0A816DWD8_ADIRI|nr:unnamed protein product [Adineta ricciae]CAF1641956.1 unnamed protein product [Adineta ricciae]